MIKPAPQKLTIYEIATLADTSPSTVSAILNGTWKKRRIAEQTALHVQALAKTHNYSVNRQASGLRTSRSGLAGMLIPTHEDRYFGIMSEAFDRMARERGLQPIVVSTMRDPALEVATAKTLITYQIDHLFVAGATDPDSVSRVCKRHNVMHVNVDLPGKLAPSVISDNYGGAVELTSTLIERSHKQPTAARDRLYFVGGVPEDYATQRRIQGFTDTVEAKFGTVRAQQVHACGYGREVTRDEVAKLYAKLCGLPRGLFLAASVCLEGAIGFLKSLPIEELQNCAFGSYDWDPFATYLRFPVHMMRQDVTGLLTEAFNIMQGERWPQPKVYEIRPHLILGD
ncbi:MAG: LacI family DNA-binding transcriptional regulator [Rhizobacter sp.]